MQNDKRINLCQFICLHVTSPGVKKNLTNVIPTEILTYI